MMYNLCTMVYEVVPSDSIVYHAQLIAAYHDILL